MTSHHPARTQSLLDPHSSAEKLTDDPTGNKSAQCTVTCLYQANIVGMWRNVTFVWCKNLINHSLNITVDTLGDVNHYICKIDFKPWHFWSKKGFKAFEVEGNQVDVFWDLRVAKFNGGSEPCMDYYVALVFEGEVVLLLGDIKKKAYKRTKSRPSLVDAILVYKKEHVFGKKCFSTRAKFDQRKKDHDIVVENSLLGPRDPEMWISIDGIVLVHVSKLQWKFRGNETVLVDKFPVQVFWDVHDWLFGTNGSGHGLFIFKLGAPQYGLDYDRDGSGGGENDTEVALHFTQSSPSVPEFSLFLYAWKIE